MPFECTLTDESAEATIEKDGNGYAVSVVIGIDSDRNLTYFLFANLDVQAGGGDWAYGFFIVEYDGDTGGEYVYWSGRDVASFIGRDDRRRILDTLISVTHILISQVKPERVHRSTHDTNLPDKALVKHQRVTDVFIECGYVIVQADTYLSTHGWIMERDSGHDG